MDSFISTDRWHRVAGTLVRILEVSDLWSLRFAILWPHKIHFSRLFICYGTSVCQDWSPSFKNAPCSWEDMVWGDGKVCWNGEGRGKGEWGWGSEEGSAVSVVTNAKWLSPSAVEMGGEGLIVTADHRRPQSHSLHKELKVNTMNSVYEARKPNGHIWRWHSLLSVPSSQWPFMSWPFRAFWTVLCLFQNKWNAH